MDLKQELSAETPELLQQIERVIATGALEELPVLLERQRAAFARFQRSDVRSYALLQQTIDATRRMLVALQVQRRHQQQKFAECQRLQVIDQAYLRNM